MDEEPGVNEVRLVGRVSRPPASRELPSGDVVWTFGLVVPRGTTSPSGRRQVDAVDCAVWRGRLRRHLPGWEVGDQVEVCGAMRRRFFRSAGGTASRVEVEVTSGKVLRRAPAA